jgi:TonB-dependent receptor
MITEEIMSAFVSTTMEGDIGGRPMQVVTGLRFEETEASSATLQNVPVAIEWNSDNDTTQIFGASEVTLSEDYKYNNLLPSLDFSVDLTDDFKARASFSRTIARPQYTYMFLPTNVSHGSTLTYLGGVPSANRGSVQLDPLVSDNFDLSFEWYYGDASYASIGYFQKAVSNFVGIEQVERQFFGLRNVTARAPGNRLDIAIQELADRGFPATEESLYTMVGILSHPEDFPNGADDYDGTPEQALLLLNQYDVMPNEQDPLYTFQTAQPVNNQTANIDGYEIAVQHFFGETGFGIQANATLVSGDIAFDNGAPPNFDQFALEGLSDSANLILVWENDVFGARLAYNWRDAFLSQANAGNYLPRYVDEYSQVDLNLSWNVTDQFSLSLDGLNLTEEGLYQYGRTYNQMYINTEQDARWVLAARYNF